MTDAEGEGVTGVLGDAGDADWERIGKFSSMDSIVVHPKFQIHMFFSPTDSTGCSRTSEFVDQQR